MNPFNSLISGLSAAGNTLKEAQARDAAAKQAEADKVAARYPNGPTRKLATDTALGQQLEGNISSQLSGLASNSLLNQQAVGNEALARKAGDIRGMAGVQSAAAGQLGQGAATAAQQQSEFQIMRNLGDFNTQIAGIAAQEQQAAMGHAEQFLGQMSNDWQMQEMQRQAMVGEDRQAANDDFTKLMQLIEDPTMQAAGGEAYDELLVNAYGRFQKDPVAIESFREGLKANAQSKKEIARVAGWAGNASPQQLEEYYNFDDPNGITDAQGNPIDPGLAEYLSSIHTASIERVNGPLYQKIGTLEGRETMTQQDWQNVMDDESLRASLNATEFEKNGDGYAVGSFIEIGDTIYRVESNKTGWRDEDMFGQGGYKYRSMKLVDPATGKTRTEKWDIANGNVPGDPNYYYR